MNVRESLQSVLSRYTFPSIHRAGRVIVGTVLVISACSTVEIKEDIYEENNKWKECEWLLGQSEQWSRCMCECLV